MLRYVTVAIVAAATVFVAIDQRDPGVVRGSGMYDHRVYTFGWPLVAGTHRVSRSMLTNPLRGMERIDHWCVNWWLVSINLATVVIVVSAAFGFARYVLPLIRFRRVSLLALLVTMTTTALIVALLAIEFDPMRRFFASLATPVGTYHPITFYPFWISIPVLYGIGCIPICMTKLVVYRWPKRDAPTRRAVVKHEACQHHSG